MSGLSFDLSSRRFRSEDGYELKPELVLRVPRDGGLPECPQLIIEMDEAGNITSELCLVGQSAEYCDYLPCA